MHANNLFYKSSPSSPAVQITFDGNHSVRNGITDWLYQGSKHIPKTYTELALDTV